jgi:hypothetical protein
MSIMPVSEHLLLNTAEPLYIYIKKTQALYHVPSAWLSQDRGVPNVISVLEGNTILL